MNPMYRTVPLLWLLLTCLPAGAAGTREVAVAPGLVVLRVEAAAGADISWEARQPMTLPLQTFEGATACVFCEHTVGRQVVVVSDVIDWDARKRDKTTWIVTVGTGPTPVPPPVPPQPEPADFGFVEFASKHASLIQSAGIKHIRTVAGNFSHAADAIREGKLLSLQSATDHASRLNAATLGSDVVAWNGWLLKVGYAVDRLEDEGTVKTVQQKAQVFDEIAAGLIKFADAQRVTVSRSLPAIVCVNGTCVEVAP
jgi:hypothetical protein